MEDREKEARTQTTLVCEKIKWGGERTQVGTKSPGCVKRSVVYTEGRRETGKKKQTEKNCGRQR